MENTYIDKVGYLYIKNRRLLMALSRGKDRWYIPGGKRERDESDEACLSREVQEELDVDIVLETVTYYGTFEAQAHGQPPGTTIKMICYTADFTGTMKASSEIERLAFFGYADFDKSSAVDHLIFKDLKARNLID